MQNLLLASTNKGKIVELHDMLSGLPINVLSLADVGLADMDVEETGDTFEANALLKARAYSAAAHLPTLADDSGIVVDALGGRPGVYSARYAPTSDERNTKLLKEIEHLPMDQRTAHFTAVIALVALDGVTVTTEGRVYGRVNTEPRGANGFGYDPIMLLDDGRTMGEISAAEKNAISHRGLALAKILPLLRCLLT